MSKSSSKFLALALLSTTLAVAPVISAFAAGSEEPKPPATDSKKAKKSNKSSSIDSPKFLAGYHSAYATIYDRHDYAAAIEQLQATVGGTVRATVSVSPA